MKSKQKVAGPVHFQSLGKRGGSGLGRAGWTVASEVHSKEDLALIKSKASSLKTGK